MKSITQEEPMGCAISCVALALGKSYKSTKKLFDHPEYSSSRGYYCREIIKVLNKSRRIYSYKKITSKTKHLLNKNEIIVFIRKNKQYPFGHYLIKTKKGWMNPWINLPKITPAKSGFQKKLPGEPEWIIYPED